MFPPPLLGHLPVHRAGAVVLWLGVCPYLLDMTGRIAPTQSEGNPNIRWKYPPPVYRQGDVRRLHHKYMIIDADTEHNPTVITGSANWSNNANTINDENTLFIYCRRIANQYTQEFYARYKGAGGSLDRGEE